MDLARQPLSGKTTASLRTLQGVVRFSRITFAGEGSFSFRVTSFFPLPFLCAFISLRPSRISCPILRSVIVYFLCYLLKHMRWYVLSYVFGVERKQPNLIVGSLPIMQIDWLKYQKLPATKPTIHINKLSSHIVRLIRA